MGDAYECIGPPEEVPDAPVEPTPSAPAAEPAPAAAAPLRDDGIDLNSNPISAGKKEAEEKKDGAATKSKKGESVSKDGGNPTTPSKESTVQSAAQPTAPTKAADPKKLEKGKGKKGGKAEQKKNEKKSLIPLIGFVVSLLVFLVCTGMTVFIAGHKWFGLTAIGAIAY